MTSLTDYILINHHLMTTAEMAEETGVDHATISNLCSRLKVRAISTADRVKEYIGKHRDQTVKQIASHLEVSEVLVLTYAKELGIALPKKPTFQEPVKQGIKYSFMHKVFERHREVDWDDFVDGIKI